MHLNQAWCLLKRPVLLAPEVGFPWREVIVQSSSQGAAVAAMPVWVKDTVHQLHCRDTVFGDSQ